MGVLLWILIGLGAGLIVAALAPEDSTYSRSGSAARRLRGAAAGLAGAVGTGFAFGIVGGPAWADPLTIAVGTLAGGLWIAAIVEAFASRSRPWTPSVPAPARPRDVPNAIDMPAYDAARQAIVAALLEDAVAHDAGRYGEIGRQLPAIRDAVAREDPSRNRRLQIALRFWTGWTDARNSHWPPADADQSIDQSIARPEWARLARTLASDLALDRDATDPIIARRFT